MAWTRAHLMNNEVPGIQITFFIRYVTKRVSFLNKYLLTVHFECFNCHIEPRAKSFTESVLLKPKLPTSKQFQQTKDSMPKVSTKAVT